MRPLYRYLILTPKGGPDGSPNSDQLAISPLLGWRLRFRLKPAGLEQTLHGSGRQRDGQRQRGRGDPWLGQPAPQGRGWAE